MEKLYYLDDRPIFEEDRILAKAYSEGGKEAERAAKKDIDTKKKELQSLTKEQKKKEVETRADRRNKFKAMMANVQQSKKDLIQEHRDLKNRLSNMRGGDPEKATVEMKIKGIEDRLNADVYTQMYDGDDMTRSLESNK